jgi:hypothetical protein
MDCARSLESAGMSLSSRALEDTQAGEHFKNEKPRAFVRGAGRVSARGRMGLSANLRDLRASRVVRRNVPGGPPAASACRWYQSLRRGANGRRLSAYATRLATLAIVARLQRVAA